MATDRTVLAILATSPSTTATPVGYDLQPADSLLSGPPKTPFTRRRFLTTTAAVALAAPAVRAQKRPATDRITMATIGCGGQGRGDMGGFMGFPDVWMVAVCDPVPAHREEARKQVNDRYGNTD